MKKRFLRPNLNDEQKAFYKFKLSELIISLVFVVYGAILLINRDTSETFIGVLLGLIVIAHGAINIYSNFMPHNGGEFKKNVVFGILYCVAGLLLIVNIFKFLEYIQIYYSAYLIIAAINQLINAIKLKTINDKSFLIVLITALLAGALGGLLLFYNYVSFTIHELIAIFSILYGFLCLNTSNLLKNRADEIIE